MSHYIAGLMDQAEAATGEQALELRAQCSAEILKLWKHRTALPGESQPLLNFDKIGRTLEELNPERPAWRRLRGISNQKEFQGPTSQLLAAALALDSASASAIRTLLEEAAKMANELEQGWLRAAPKLDKGDPINELIDALILTPTVGNGTDDVGTKSLDTSIRLLSSAIEAIQTVKQVLKAVRSDKCP